MTWEVSSIFSWDSIELFLLLCPPLLPSQCYIPLWILALNILFFHSRLSLAISLLFYFTVIFKSSPSWNWCSLFLVRSIVAVAACFDIVGFCIHSSWPDRLSPTDSVHFKADSHVACRAHAVPLPCRAAKGLKCVFPIGFGRCGPVWFTLPCRDNAMLWPCRGLEKNGMVRTWHGNGMASVNQTRPHCVNQMGKTRYKPLRPIYT